MLGITVFLRMPLLRSSKMLVAAKSAITMVQRAGCQSTTAIGTNTISARIIFKCFAITVTWKSTRRRERRAGARIIEISACVSRLLTTRRTAPA